MNALNKCFTESWAGDLESKRMEWSLERRSQRTRASLRACSGCVEVRRARPGS